MAVPFRRTGKTAKRKRRTHKKLTAPTLVVCPNTGEFTLPHRVTKNSGYYKGKLILMEKSKEDVNTKTSATPVKETVKKEKTVKTEPKKAEPKKVETKKTTTTKSSQKKTTTTK